ncbi:hypothetical protein NDU88_004223 [Pleurodeles waltl]|uniref:Secreted protein n=1 Tax=Pleurodeles waltl TaxID=8319 RepID=A0AAV7KZQ5_PLEWA|nr:hypothetical protein NDU88_004223 [Pleurodeles waltl]
MRGCLHLRRQASSDTSHALVAIYRHPLFLRSPFFFVLCLLLRRCTRAPQLLQRRGAAASSRTPHRLLSILGPGKGPVTATTAVRQTWAIFWQPMRTPKALLYRG